MHTTDQNKKELVRLQNDHASGNTATGFDMSFDVQISDNDSRKLPRSMVYVETMCGADLISRQDDEIITKLKDAVGDEAADEIVAMGTDELADEISDMIDEEVPEKDALIGVFCRCYIEGCDCHEITPEGRIKEHFSIGQELPAQADFCREYLKSNENCAFVEIYSDCMVAVSKDSTTEII